MGLDAARAYDRPGAGPPCAVSKERIETCCARSSLDFASNIPIASLSGSVLDPADRKRRELRRIAI
jgi:hypothetical protein